MLERERQASRDALQERERSLKQLKQEVQKQSLVVLVPCAFL